MQWLRNKAKSYRWRHSADVSSPPESTEWFTEFQAFLLSYDSAPRPPLYPLSRQQVVSLSQPSCVSPVEFTGGGDGVGEEPNHTTARKPGPLHIIQYVLAPPICSLLN